MSQATIYKWRVYCNTEATYHTVWSETEPDYCPVDPVGHTIDANKTTIIEIRKPDLVTIKEEEVPTNGAFQISSIAFDASGNMTSQYVHSYPMPVTILSASTITLDSMQGDIINVSVAPNTTIGVLTANVSSGIYELPVSQTVIDNTITGLFINLVDASGSVDLGRILVKNTASNTITMHMPTTRSHAAFTTLVQMTSRFAHNLEVGYAGKYRYAGTKIGGAYLPANTPVLFEYTRTQAGKVRPNFYIEYLY